jgi:HK97 gp10 family phage protein
MSVKITGGDKLLRMLRNGPKSATEGLRKTIRKEGTALATAMRSAAPKGPTGLLSRSIRARYSSGGLVAKVGLFGLSKQRLAAATAGLRMKQGISRGRALRVASALGRNPFYARFVEFGTRRTPAQPYLYTTFGAKRPAIRQAIIRDVTVSLRKAAK